MGDGVVFRAIDRGSLVVGWRFVSTLFEDPTDLPSGPSSPLQPRNQQNDWNCECPGYQAGYVSFLVIRGISYWIENDWPPYTVVSDVYPFDL